MGIITNLLANVRPRYLKPIEKLLQLENATTRYLINNAALAPIPKELLKYASGFNGKKIRALASLNNAALKVINEREALINKRDELQTPKDIKNLERLINIYKNELMPLLVNRVSTKLLANKSEENIKQDFSNAEDIVGTSLSKFASFDGKKVDLKELRTELERIYELPKEYLESEFNPVAVLAKSFFILNELTTISTEAQRNENDDNEFAKNLMTHLYKEQNLSLEQIKNILEKLVKISIIITSHPTPGLTTDWGRTLKEATLPIRSVIHTNNLDQKTNKELKEELDKRSNKENQNSTEGLASIISRAVNMSLFNNKEITPLDETKNLIENLKPFKIQLPRIMIAIEDAYSKLYESVKGEKPPADQFEADKSILSLRDILKARSWTASDIDGNGNNTLSEYMKSFVEKWLDSLNDYEKRINTLKESYREDPKQINLVGDDLKKLLEYMGYRTDSIDFPQEIIDKGQSPYKTILETYKKPGSDSTLSSLMQEIKTKLESFQRELELIEKQNCSGKEEEFKAKLPELISLTKRFSINDYLEPLRAIEKNIRKISPIEYHDLQGAGHETRELIKGIRAFSDTGAKADMRQGADITEELAGALASENNLDSLFNDHYNLTNYLLDSKENKETDPAKNLNYSDNYGLEKGPLDKLRQTNDLLEATKLGEIDRYILSMTKSHSHLRNALFISKLKGLFKSAEFTSDNSGEIKVSKLPESKLEIVPLTELIPDLDDAYKATTINALTDPAFRQYLIANKGVMTKMEGPSDSGKLSGTFASWSAMMQTQYFDARTIEIFNDFLHEKLDPKNTNGKTDNAESKWEKHLTKVKQSIADKEGINIDSIKGDDYKELKVVSEAIAAFTDSFSKMGPEEIALWKEAGKKENGEINSIKYKIIDGLGGPVIRGNSSDGRDGISPVLVLESLYEQTAQGAEADKWKRPGNAANFIYDRLSTVIKNTGDKVKSLINGDTKPLTEKDPKFIDPVFFKFQNDLSEILRKSLREELMGIKFDDDENIIDEVKTRDYIKSVILYTPALLLGLYDNGSRPVTRSGQKISALMKNYKNNLPEMVKKLPKGEMKTIINDMRAIPIAAFYDLVGFPHIASGGYSKLDTANDGSPEATKIYKLKKQFKDYYNIEKKYKSKQDMPLEDKLISRFMKDVVNGLEKVAFRIDPDLYQYSAELISEKLPGLGKNELNKAGYVDNVHEAISKDWQAIKNLVAEIKNYIVQDPKKVNVRELYQRDPFRQRFYYMHRQNAKTLKASLIQTIGEIYKATQSNEKRSNPYDKNLILEKYPNLAENTKRLISAISTLFKDESIDG